MCRDGRQLSARVRQGCVIEAHTVRLGCEIDFHMYPLSLHKTPRVRDRRTLLRMRAGTRAHTRTCVERVRLRRTLGRLPIEIRELRKPLTHPRRTLGPYSGPLTHPRRTLGGN